LDIVTTVSKWMTISNKHVKNYTLNCLVVLTYSAMKETVSKITKHKATRLRR